MNQDLLHRYIFENISVRGELVQLSSSFQALINSKKYPLPIQNLLGQLMATTSLLTATLKFEGSITVQIQGDGPVSLVVINGNHNQVMRGTARWKDDVPSTNSLKKLIGKGHIVITIEPEQGERYQGIVGLEQDTLAECIEDYFSRSEQLNTRIWLKSGDHNGAVAAGMLLQSLPDHNDNSKDFDHLVKLTETIKDEELFELDAETILYRLYHQEEVKLFPADPVSFKCSCSKERSAAAISSLSSEDIEDMLAQNNRITLHCDYCGTDYHFDRQDIFS